MRNFAQVIIQRAVMNSTLVCFYLMYRAVRFIDSSFKPKKYVSAMMFDVTRDKPLRVRQSPTMKRNRQLQIVERGRPHG